jgi:chromosomal replication initiation ATPase DnaA
MKKRIAELVGAEFGIPASKVFSRSQCRKHAEPRHVAIMLLKLSTGFGKKAIGNMIHRDHAAIHNSFKRFNSLCDTDQDYKEKFNRLQTLLTKCHQQPLPQPPQKKDL